MLSKCGLKSVTNGKMTFYIHTYIYIYYIYIYTTQVTSFGKIRIRFRLGQNFPGDREVFLLIF